MARISLTLTASLGFMLAPLYLHAEPQVVCTVSDCATFDISIPETARAPNLAFDKAWEFASEILAVSGLAPNFQVAASDSIPNAAAIVRSSERFIIFNPNWLETLSQSASSDWETYAVLAHEIGHHLQGHTLLGIGSRPPIELEADSYAGFVLGALGADLDEASALWRDFREAGSATHPPRHQRLAAVERGWLQATRHRIPPQNAAPDRESAEPFVIDENNVALQPKRRLERDISLDAACAPTVTALGQAVTCVTSNRGSSSSPAHLWDNDPTTHWTEDSFQAGIGETVAVEFATPTTIRRITFHSALAADATTVSSSPRVKELKVATSSGFVGTITLQDLLDWQFVPLPLVGIDWISFTIQSTYEGLGPQNTTLAEINFE